MVIGKGRSANDVFFPSMNGHHSPEILRNGRRLASSVGYRECGDVIVELKMIEIYSRKKNHDQSKNIL